MSTSTDIHSVRLDAALPFLVTAVLTLLSSPILNTIIRKNLTTQRSLGNNEEDIGDAAIWAIDQYQLLSLTVMTVAIGAFFAHANHHLALEIGTYVICAIIAPLGAFAIVWNYNTASDYVSKSRVGRVPYARRLFSRVPVVKTLSIAVVASVLILALGGGAAALFA